MAMPESAAGKDINEGKVFALLAYLSILCIIPLLLKKDNDFVLAHGKQGLVIFVGQVAVFILHIIFGQWFLKVGMFILFVFSFIGMIATISGKYLALPIVAKIAEKITL